LSTVAVVVVTNSRSLLEYLQTVDDGAVDVELSRDFGETRITGQSLLTTPRWTGETLTRSIPWPEPSGLPGQQISGRG
jgi:hypothetical protein